MKPLLPITVEHARKALKDRIFAEADDNHGRAVESAIYRMHNSEIARCYLRLVASVMPLCEDPQGDAQKETE